MRWQVESGSERCSSTARRCGRAAEGWQCGGYQGDAEWTRRDIVEHRRMAVEVPAARDTVRRQAEDGTIVGGGMEDWSGGGRRIGRWKMHRKQRQSPRQKGVA